MLQHRKKAVLCLLCVCLAGICTALTIQFVAGQSRPAPILVCLDAGHGGKDSGAQNGSRLEKEDNLRLTLLVRDRLESMGISVFLTRSDDTYLTLEERCKRANRKNCSLFVSLHRNSAESGSGVEIWVKNTPSDTEWALAESILNGLTNAGISIVRGVKSGYAKNADGNYYVNAHTDMPSCLAEIGFITSDKDNALFDENIDAYADAIAAAIRDTLQSLGETA